MKGVEVHFKRKVINPPGIQAVIYVASLLIFLRSWQRQRGRILRLPMAELSQVCQACARVKYFDSQSFADIIAAVKASPDLLIAKKCEKGRHAFFLKMLSAFLFGHDVQYGMFTMNKLVYYCEMHSLPMFAQTNCVVTSIDVE